MHKQENSRVGTMAHPRHHYTSTLKSGACQEFLQLQCQYPQLIKQEIKSNRSLEFQLTGARDGVKVTAIRSNILS